MEYTEKVMEHFMNPHNVGELENANAVGEVGNAKCGDIMRMSMYIENGIIKDYAMNTLCAAGTGAFLTSQAKRLKIDIKDFGKHLKYKRTSQGLSLLEASQLCNINTTTLIRLEKGSDGVRFSTALNVAKMFGLKLYLE